VAILDVPYAFNDAAKRGESNPSPAEFARVRQIGDERERMVKRVLHSSPGLTWSLLRWEDLEDSSVRNLRKELTWALRKPSELRFELLESASNWAGSAGVVSSAELLGFQIAELPLLLSIYYQRSLLVDLYPGELTPFFFDLEAGRWSHELPTATAITGGQRLSLIDFASAAPTASTQAVGVDFPLEELVSR